MAPQNLRAVGDRIEQLLDELHASADPRRRASGRGAAAPGRPSSTAGGWPGSSSWPSGAPGWSTLRRDELIASLLWCTGSTRTPRRAGAAALEPVRPFSPATAATWSCSSVDEDAGAVHLRCWAAATAARRRRSRCSSRSSARIVEAAPEITDVDVDAARADRSSPVVLGTKPTVDECPRGPGGRETGSTDPLAVLQRIRASPPAPDAAGRGALRAVHRADRRTTTATRRPGAAQPPVRVPRLLPALHRRRRGWRPLPRRPRPLPRFPDFGCRPASGTRCRSR